MTNSEIARRLHNLAVDLELSGRVKESEACRLATGLILSLTPKDWALVTVHPSVSSGVQLGDWESGRE